MKPILIDAFDFGRQKLHRDGEVAVLELPRLASECVDPSGTLQWSVDGGAHATGQVQLLIRVSGPVQLMCQRCMQPFAYAIDSESVLVLANDDAHADQVEAMLDDDTIDVIVATHDMTLADLIEDEALLALPQSPKHARCPGQVSVNSEAVDAPRMADKPSPFAVLKNIKH
jgi:uncharacterized protein